jgi:predicted HicB family RNase H-like nuclease
MKQAHGNTGNQNAAKGGKTLSARVTGRVTPDVRLKAEKAAQDNGESLSQYVGRVVAESVSAC